MAQLNNIRTVNVPSIGKLPLAANPGTFTPSAPKRTPKPGRLPEDAGHTETYEPAKLELSINLRGGLDLDALNAISGEDVTVRLADGSVYLLAQAYVTDPVSVGDGESKMTLQASRSERI